MTEWKNLYQIHTYMWISLCCVEGRPVNDAHKGREALDEQDCQN